MIVIGLSFEVLSQRLVQFCANAIAFFSVERARQKKLRTRMIFCLECS